MSNAQSLLTELQTKCDAGDTVGGRETLQQLKIAMLDLPIQDDVSRQLSIKALELGVLLMVADGDLDAFGRNVAQLKPLYAETATTGLGQKCHILGLNLMNLLVDNRLSEFHAELELLSGEEASHKYVTFPIDLERQLMVGQFDQILNLSLPHVSYQFFVDHLLQTVRDSIADCVEVSYTKMKIIDALQIMKFTSKTELFEYIEECRDDWIINSSDNELQFQPPTSGHQAAEDIPSMKLISQSLSYATELERIV